MQRATRLFARRGTSLTPRSTCSLRTFTSTRSRQTGGPTSGPSNDLQKETVDEDKPIPEHPKNDTSFANKVESKIGEASDMSTNKDPAKMADKAENIMPSDSMDPDPQQNKTFGQDK